MSGHVPGGAVPGAVADQLSLRRSNLSRVLRSLAADGPRSRARIADDTGLTKATVSSLVSELIARGLLREGPLVRAQIGRPASLVEVRGAGAYGVGIEVNVDYLAVTTVDLAGEVVAAERVPLETRSLAPDDVFDEISRAVRRRTGGRPAGSHLAGITVGVPGGVDRDRGRLTYAPNLGWSDVGVLDALRARLGEDVPLRLDNEANLAALGEFRAGASAGTPDLLLLTGEVGVGGGVITGGQLLRGAKGYSGEVGHMLVDPAGTVCACGRRGCWETVVGLGALLRAATAGGPTDRDRVLLDPRAGLDDRLDELVRRAQRGDPRTLQALDELGRWLGTGASLLVNVLNPSVVVLGGFYAPLGPWLLDSVRTQLAQRVVAPEAGGCRVETSVLGFSAAVRGGALTALEAVFDDPTSVAAAGPPAPPASGSGPPSHSSRLSFAGT